ncbi:MAG: DUF4199 domain-containing protein [Alphaproteobacteria bacterium]|nr:DUF4199 domain-containing protein [Alphaproteobacteria bacterium]
MPKMSFKWLFLFGLMVFGQFSLIAETQAQTTGTRQNIGGMSGVYAQKYRDFVDEKQLKGLKDLAANQVYCGTKENICNTDTQICIKCSRNSKTVKGVIKSGQRQEGYCASRTGNKVIGTREAWKLAEKASGCFAAAWEAKRDAEERSGWGKFWAGVWDVVYDVDYTISAEPNGFLEEKYQKTLLGMVTLKNNDEERTFCNPNDETECYLLFSDADSSSLAYAGAKKTKDGGKNISRGCEVLPIKIYNLSKCFFCPMAAAVFDAANSVTSLSFKKLGDAFRKLIVVAFALWLAFASLQIVFTYIKQDGNKYLSSILVQGGKFLFAYFLLANSYDLFAYFVSPILKTGISMALHIGATNVSPINYVPSAIESDQYFNAGNLYGEIELFLAGVQAQLSVMQGIGTTLFCVGFHQITMITGISDVFGFWSSFKIGIQILLLGAILFVFAILLTVSFGFYFLDALIQMAILGAMMPLMIAGWPFKITSSYANTGKEMLLNVFFTIFFIGFVISVEINLIDKALEEINRASIYEATTTYDDDGNVVKEGDASNRSGGLGGLFNAINNQNGDQIRDIASIGFSGFLILIFACFFGFQFVSNVPKLADKLAEGANTGVAVNAGTTMASAAKGAANVATKPFREMAREKWVEKGGAMGAFGRVLKAPGKVAGLLGRSKTFSAAGRVGNRAVQAFSNSKVGRGLGAASNFVGGKVRGAVQWAGQTKIGGKVRTASNFVGSVANGSRVKQWGAKMTLAGRNAISDGRARKGVGGFFQRMGGGIVRKVGQGFTGRGNKLQALDLKNKELRQAISERGVFGKEGVLQSLGTKLETKGKVMAKRRLEAEKEAGLRSRFEADFMRKYGRLPTSAETSSGVKSLKAKKANKIWG